VEHLSLMLNVVLRHMQTESWNLGHFVVFYFNAVLDLSSNCVLRLTHLRHTSHLLLNVLILHPDRFFKFAILHLFGKVTWLKIECFTFANLRRD
jgi:hypothetical protein